jgi:hypothetical protein
MISVVRISGTVSEIFFYDCSYSIPSPHLLQIESKLVLSELKSQSFFEA